MDESGNIVIGGRTGSTDFPTTSNAYDTTYNGGDTDAFVALLDPTGANLLYSTFIGGSQIDAIRDLETQSAGNIVVTGRTFSSDFPVSQTAFDTSFNGTADVMVARLDLNQAGEAQLVWSTFLGGSGFDRASNIVVDPSGSVLVSGRTASADFPTTPSAFDANYNGGNRDAFVAQLDPVQTGSAQLNYSTFLGGAGTDNGNAMVVHSPGIVTLAGHTFSTNFPTTSDAVDASHNGSGDIFLSRLDLNQAAEAQLIYSTFVGGSGNDAANAMALDASGNVIVAGWTFSQDLPVTPNAFDETWNGNADGFILRLNMSGVFNALDYVSYLGADQNDWAFLLALDNSGTPIIGGYTSSSNFPTIPGSFDETFNGGQDAFLARVALDPFLPASDTLFASLDGNQEVPALFSPCTGIGVFRYDAQTGELQYEISIENLLGNITAAHFHAGTSSANGPVVKTLFSGVINGDTTFTGVWTGSDVEPLDASLLPVLFQKNIYVNVHTDRFPAGEIRGQVVF